MVIIYQRFGPAFIKGIPPLHPLGDPNPPVWMPRFQDAFEAHKLGPKMRTKWRIGETGVMCTSNEQICLNDPGAPVFFCRLIC